MDGEPGTTLTIDEFLLRPWRRADAPALLAVCQDPEIARWVTIPQPFLPVDADAFIENALTMWRDGTGAPFAIVDAATGRLLGAVTRFGPEGHQATFGLWLAPDARGRGVGARALRRVAEWTFETTAALRLDAFIMVGNEPSERMVERAGWQREGVLRAWDLHHGGVPVDCVVYSRLRSDKQEVFTTRGVPVNASNTMAVYMFDRSFVRFEFGYGSAVAVILFHICFVLALAYQRWVLRRDTEGATTYG